MTIANSPIVFGVIHHDAAERWPGRNLLLDEIARVRPLILLESYPGEARVRAPRPIIERLHDQTFVVRNAGPAVASRKVRSFLTATSLIQRRQIRHEFQRWGWRTTVLWLTVADPLLARIVPHDALVFDCMDPNFVPGHDEKHERRLGWIGRRAEVVFASAHSLLDQMAGRSDIRYLLPNAADPAAARPVESLVSEWRGRLEVEAGRPVIGYLGTVDWRFDAPFVTSVAVAMPDADFVIAGRVNSDQAAAVEELANLPNVRFTGQLGYDDGYAVNALFDVGLIPFHEGAMNDCVNSVKMFMYLLTGIPVVSTWLRESRLNEFVTATRTPLEMVEAIRVALADSEAAAAGQEWASRNTWHDRALEALDLLSRHGLAQPDGGGNR